jgi:hypothetical protein
VGAVVAPATLLERAVEVLAPATLLDGALALAGELAGAGAVLAGAAAGLAAASAGLAVVVVDEPPEVPPPYAWPKAAGTATAVVRTPALASASADCLNIRLVVISSVSYLEIGLELVAIGWAGAAA